MAIKNPNPKKVRLVPGNPYLGGSGIMLQMKLKTFVFKGTAFLKKFSEKFFKLVVCNPSYS